MGHLFDVSVEFDCSPNGKNLKPSLLSLDEHYGLTFDGLVIPYFRVHLWEGKVEIGYIEHDDEETFLELFNAFVAKVKAAGYKVRKIDYDGLEDWVV
jgi:hypothetical protein